MGKRYAIDISVRSTDNMSMTPSDLKSHFGGTQSAAASFLGVRQGLLSEWEATGHIPVSWQIVIERQTFGKLKADLDAAVIDVARRRKLLTAAS